MLNNVPTQINRSVRLVTLRHPNAMDCTVWRKQVNRTAAAEPLEMGGLPTLGGLGMLDSEDEADFSFVELGDAKIVFAGQFLGEGANWNDAETGLNYPAPPMEALIECLVEPGQPGYFLPDKPDMVSVEPGNGMVVLYEVIGATGSVNIPPYTRKLVLAPRQDQNVGI